MREIPDDVGAALPTQVSRLRKALPGDTLVTQPPGYRLVAEPHELDATRFGASSASWLTVLAGMATLWILVALGA